MKDDGFNAVKEEIFFEEESTEKPGGVIKKAKKVVLCSKRPDFKGVFNVSAFLTFLWIYVIYY